MQNEDLLELLIDFGEVENVQIPKDNDLKRNKGYAFVLFKKAEEAKRFQMFMSGKEFLGKKLRYIFIYN
jgi:RNA recognition motif-containing protein